MPSELGKPAARTKLRRLILAHGAEEESESSPITPVSIGIYKSPSSRSDLPLLIELAPVPPNFGTYMPDAVRGFTRMSAHFLHPETVARILSLY